MDQQHDTPADLTPEQLARELEARHSAFRATHEEEERRTIALSHMDAATWRRTAASCIVHFVESYKLGEISMRDVIAGMHRVTVGCLPQDRVSLLGLAALLALQETPLKRKPGHRPAPWPLWLRNVTADLVLHKQEMNPGMRRAPYEHSRSLAQPASSATALALEILDKIGWFGEMGVPTPGTVDDWVRARLKEGARAHPDSTSA